MKNYIDIINRFWERASEIEGFKGDHVSLFFLLLDCINRNKWRETEVEYGLLTSRLRMGKGTYLDCRNWLAEHHFLIVIPGRGDYAKAKFNVGSAVLSSTAHRTADETAYRTAHKPHLIVNSKTSKQVNNSILTKGEKSKKSDSEKKELLGELNLDFLPPDWLRVRKFILASDSALREARTGLKNHGISESFEWLVDQFLSYYGGWDGKRLPWYQDDEARKHFLRYVPSYLTTLQRERSNIEIEQQRTQRYQRRESGKTQTARKSRPVTDLDSALNRQSSGLRNEVKPGIDDTDFEYVE